MTKQQWLAGRARPGLLGPLGAALRGLGLGAVLGAAYGVVVACFLMTASLVLDDGLAGLADVGAWVTLMLIASAFALLIGGVIGALGGGVLGALLWWGVAPLSRVLRPSRAARYVRTEPLAAGLIAAAFGLLLMPSRVVFNTTMLLAGSGDLALQLVVGKLLPTALLTAGAVLLWPAFTRSPE